MRGRTARLMAVVALALVAGAMWFVSQRSHAPADETTTSNNPASLAAPIAKATAAVTKGELCPEPVPASESPDPSPAIVRQVPAKAGLPRLVDLGATTCKACKELAPILDALREEYKGRLSVEFIDVWKNRGAGKPYEFRVIPTQILFDKEGKEVWRHEGFISKEDLKTVFAEKVDVRLEA